MKYLLIGILLIPTVAAEYYAEIDIWVDERGLVDITGNTNNPNLLLQDSDAHTSKKGPLWLLNITLEDRYESMLFKLHLPKGAEVNYLRTPSLNRIETEGGRLTIIGTANDRAFVLLTQYKIDMTRYKNNLNTLLIVLIFIAIGYSLYRLKTRKRYDISPLTKRQQKIFTIIRKSKKPVTQKYIEKSTDLPKSSVSRNVDTLVKKGYIEKHSKGMSNVLKLK